MQTLSFLDLFVLVAYLAGITAVGIVAGRRQKDARDYFVADRAIAWWGVRVSIVATETRPPHQHDRSLPGDLGFLKVRGYIRAHRGELPIRPDTTRESGHGLRDVDALRNPTRGHQHRFMAPRPRESWIFATGHPTS